jgi:hypothetical protein
MEPTPQMLTAFEIAKNLLEDSGWKIAELPVSSSGIRSISLIPKDVEVSNPPVEEEDKDKIIADLRAELEKTKKDLNIIRSGVQEATIYKLRDMPHIGHS